MRNVSQAEMDQIINDHFMYEFTDNVDEVVSTLTEDVVHEIVGGPWAATGKSCRPAFL